VSFLTDLIFEYLGRTLTWLAAEAALAAVGLALVFPLLRLAGRVTGVRSLLWAAFGGALLAASLVARFDWPVVIDLTVWRRSAPVIWSVAGAALVAAAWGAATAPGGRSRPGTDLDRHSGR
jgi:hypothetical protein